MRILCLHDINSSAPLLLDQIHDFAKKLHDKHNIELAFVNSPLIVSNHHDSKAMATMTSLNGASDSADDGDGAVDGSSTCKNDDAGIATTSNDSKKEDTSHDIKRTWYYKNTTIETETATTTTTNSTTTDKKFIGLDASILSLSQIWNQSLYSNPFHGIMGIGQGAALASLMPLLEKEQSILSNHSGDDNDDYDYDWHDRNMMFEGIKFCIFFNGYDLLNYNDATNGDYIDENDHDANGTNDTKEVNHGIDPDYHYYGEVQDIPSLHIISSTTTSPKSESQTNITSSSSSPKHQTRSIQLFQRYGGYHTSSNAQVQYIQSTSTSLNNKNKTLIYNIIGKFLVHQKKAMNTNKRKKKKKKISANNDNNNGGNSKLTNDENYNENAIDEYEIEAMIEKAQMKLAIIEEKAHSIIASTVALNPPKSLMAIITPDVSSNGDNDNNNAGSSSTLVGGWAGHKDAFRSEGFKQSGGAPCPKEFVLKQEERLK